MAYTPIPDDILDDVFRSNATAGGIYLDRYGKYKLLIEQSFYKQIKEVGRCWITKIQVLESAPLTVEEPDTVKQPGGRVVTEEPHPPGYRPSYTINWDGDAKLSADGNAKALVLGIFGLSEGKMSEAEFKSTMRDMCGDAQPACGMVVYAEVRPKAVGKDKSTGKYSHHIRLPYWQSLGVPGQGENTFELIASRRAEVEKYIGSEMARDAQREAERQNRGLAGAFAPANGAPALPTLPQSPAQAPGIPAQADPLAGWQLHAANQPGDADPWYWKGSDIKRKSDVLAGR